MRSSGRQSWTGTPTWTAHDTHAYPGEGAICLGCAILLGPAPTLSKNGRPLRWPLYTLATDGRRCRWAMKDAKRQIAAWVEDPSMSVSVADRGKKHVAYMVALQRDPGRVTVALDGVRVNVLRQEWLDLRAVVDHAYEAGVPKASLAAALLGHADWRRLGVQDGRELSRTLRLWQHTPTLALVVWLAQRPTEGAT